MQFELLAPVPAVVLARRLHETPLFSFASVDELFRFSSIARQVRHAEGGLIQRRGAPAEYIQVLVEGKASVSTPDAPEEHVEPPRLFGFREVLEGVSLRETARALETSICLAMEAEDFRSLLSDNIELAEGLFRMLLKTPPRSPSSSLGRDVAPATAPAMAPAPSAEMRPIDKGFLLQRLPIFSRADAQELLELAATAREIPMTPGLTLFGEGDPPSVWVILSGEITLQAPGGLEPLQLAAGDVMGIDETLTGTAMGWRARAQQPGRALRIGREDLFELLAERTDLLQVVCRSLFQTAQGRRR